MGLIVETTIEDWAERQLFLEELQKALIDAGVPSGAIRPIIGRSDRHTKSANVEAIAIIGVALKAIDTSIGIIKLIMERRKLKAELAAGAEKLDVSTKTTSTLRAATEINHGDAVITVSN